jgi:hypothetical protein
MATTIDFIVKNGLLVQGVGASASTSTGTGALVVNGGAGFNGDIHAHNIFANNAEVLTTSTIGTYDKIVHSITPGTDISVNTTTNYVTINVTSTLQSVTDRGSTTTNLIKILNNTSATSTSSGALTVAGGVGIAGNTYVGGNLVVSGTINATITGVISTASNLANGATTNIPFQSGVGQTSFSNDLIFNDSTKQFSVGLANIWGDTTLGYGVSSITNVTISADPGNSIQLVSDTEAILNYNNTTTVRADLSGVELAVGNNTLDWNQTGILSINGSGETADFLGAGALKLTGGAFIGNNVYVTNGLSAASLTGRNLTNGRITYTSGGQLTDSPLLLYDNVKITVPGLTTTGTVSINNPTQSTNSLTGALIVDGGVGIAGNLNVGGGLHVWGPTTFGNAVVFSGTATYVLSTNTVYTDNILELHTTGTVSTPWTFDDGKDIGLRFHYYNRTLNTGTNAALVLANDTQWLEWYGSGAEGTSTFAGSTYGGFKAGEIWAVNTANATTSSNSGALSVGGGASIAQDLWVGGLIYQGGDRVVTASQLSTATVTRIESGTGISVTTNTGVVVISSTATLQNVTDQGAITTNVICINNNSVSTSTNTGALQVIGGVGIGGNLNVGGSTSSFFGGMGISGNLSVGGSTSTFSGRVGIGTSTPDSPLVIRSATVSWKHDSLSHGHLYSEFVNSGGVQYFTIRTNNGSPSLRFETSGKDIHLLPAVNVGIGTTSPIAKLHVAGGAYITGTTTITNITAAVSTITGALQVSGGVGIGGDLYASRLFDNSIRVLTNITPVAGAGINVTSLSTSDSSVSFTIVNTGVTSLSAGTDTSVSTTTGNVTVWNNSTLQSVTDRGSSTTNSIYISNATAVSTYTGALVVNGGVGISGDLWIGGTLYASGQSVLTTSSFVNSTSAGDDIRITEGNSGTIVISNTSTLQSVTGRGATTTNVINFANTSNSISSSTGAVIIDGGVAINKNLNVYGTTSTFSGNVGIGTLSPNTKLQVEGAVRFATAGAGTNYLEFNRVASNQWKFTSDGIGDIFNISGNSITFDQNVIVKRGGLEVSPTLASAANAVNILQTWNNTATVFSLIKGNVTDTTSSSTSLLLDLQVGGNSRFRVGKTGLLSVADGSSIVPSITGITSPTSGFSFLGSEIVYVRAGSPMFTLSFEKASLGNTGNYAWSSTASSNGTSDLLLARDAAGTLAQRNGGNAQTFRIYNTFTDATNYERGVIGWTTSTFVIGTENSGTGALRNVNLIGGNIGIGINTPASKLHVSGTVQISGITTMTNTTNATTTASGALQVLGGASVVKDLVVGGNLIIDKTVADPAAVIVGTSPITLDSFAITEYRSAKYFISISNTATNLYQTTEIWLVQDGVSAHIEQTSVFSNGTNVVAFTTDVTAGTVSLIALGANSNNQLKVQSTYITV